MPFPPSTPPPARKSAFWTPCCWPYRDSHDPSRHDQEFQAVPRAGVRSAGIRCPRGAEQRRKIDPASGDRDLEVRGRALECPAGRGPGGYEVGRCHSALGHHLGSAPGDEPAVGGPEGHRFPGHVRASPTDRDRRGRTKGRRGLDLRDRAPIRQSRAGLRAAPRRKALRPRSLAELSAAGDKGTEHRPCPAAFRHRARRAAA